MSHSLYWYVTHPLYAGREFLLALIGIAGLILALAFVYVIGRFVYNVIRLNMPKVKEIRDLVCGIAFSAFFGALFYICVFH
jgi:ABC-type Fe3+-siderophore transport system permease subunit